MTKELKKYTNTFTGSTFPDDEIRLVKVTLNPTIIKEYLPILNALPFTKGVKLLATAMCKQEGFMKGSRSYRTLNPGNVGNTDSGANVHYKTLKEGIVAQCNNLQRIAAGGSSKYPIGLKVTLKPYISPEVVAHQDTYGMSGYFPGYVFVYTGQLDQFIKIYAVGSRATNSYLNTIISYFAMNGVTITPATTLAEIVAIK